MDPELLISFGGELKALGEGKFGGYLVRFTTANDPDLTGDYFTKSTEFFLEDGDPIPILYDHGLNKTLLKRKIGRASVKFTDAGLWVDGELNLRDDFEKAIYDKLVVAGKSGLSSGAASHLVERKNIEGKKGVSEILSWGLAEGSITVAPTEPRNTAHAYSMKSYIENRVDPFADGPPLTTGSIEPPPAPPVSTTPAAPVPAVKSETDPPAPPLTTQPAVRSMKGIFEEELAEITPSSWQLMDVLREVCCDIANAASTVDISGGVVDVTQKVTEAVTEYKDRLIPLIVKQINDYVESDNSGNEGRFYLRSFAAQDLQSFLTVKGGLVSETALDEHSAKVVSAAQEYAGISSSFDEGLKSYVKRVKEKARFRTDVKAGRVLSAATVDKLAKAHGTLATIMEAMKDSHGQIGELMDLAAPKEKPQEEEGGKSITDVGVLQMELELARQRTEAATA